MAGAAKPPFDRVAYGLLFSLSIFAVLFTTQLLPRAYFHIWSSEVKLLGSLRIDTPQKFAGFAILSVANTLVSELVRQTLGNFMVNCVNDHKTSRREIHGSDLYVHVTVQMYVLYAGLSRTLGIFFLFSSFWFVILQTLTTSAVTYHVTKRNMSMKPP